MMKATLLAASCGALTFGCTADLQGDGAGEIQEIVDNLVQAGFPADDIQIVDGNVYTGRDALVTLQASREMIQSGEGTEEQYRTYQATDECGNIGTGSATVTVPGNQGNQDDQGNTSGNGNGKGKGKNKGASAAAVTEHSVFLPFVAEVPHSD